MNEKKEQMGNYKKEIGILKFKICFIYKLQQNVYIFYQFCSGVRDYMKFIECDWIWNEKTGKS